MKIKTVTIKFNKKTKKYVSEKDYKSLEEKYNNLLNNSKKEYKIGEEVKWCGLDWLVIKIENEEVTLLLKNKLNAEQLNNCGFEHDSYNDIKFNLDSTDFDWKKSNIRKCCIAFVDKYLDKTKLIKMKTNYDENKYSNDYIRLLTIREAEKISNEIRKINASSGYWTMSPSVLNAGTYARVFAVSSAGCLDNWYVYYTYGVRPVIKLKTEDLL